MRDLRLFLPGQFEDAFIYMGKIVAVTVDQSIMVYDLEVIVSDLEDKIPELAPLATFMFSRNDWLATPQFKNLLKNQDIAGAFLRAFDRYSNQPIELEPQKIRGIPLSLDIKAEVILDILVYFGRLYLSANNGFYHADVDWNSERPVTYGHFKKRHDARCISATAKYGAVLSSCGDNGLFTATDEFQWTRFHEVNGMEQTDRISIRAEWSKYDVVNYWTSSKPYLFRSKHQKIKTGEARTRREDERTVLTEIENERIELDYLLASLFQKYALTDEAIQYMYNSNNVFFIHTYDGHFYSLGLRHSDTGRPVPTFTRTYKGASARVLSSQPLKGSYVIETDKRVFLFSNSNWDLILDEPVVTVRTFVRSRHYQNLIVAITESGLMLVSIFDDSDLVVSDS